MCIVRLYTTVYASPDVFMHDEKNPRNTRVLRGFLSHHYYSARILRLADSSKSFVRQKILAACQFAGKSFAGAPGHSLVRVQGVGHMCPPYFNEIPCVLIEDGSDTNSSNSDVPNAKLY